MVFTRTKQNDGHFLRGIELSDAPSQRRDVAGSGETSAPGQGAQVDRMDQGPSISLKSGMSRKQKIGVGILGGLSLAALAGTSAWGGVETGKVGSLRRSNQGLANKLTTTSSALAAAKTLNAQLQEQVATYAAPAPTAPTPAAAPNITALRYQYNNTNVYIRPGFANRLMGGWNVSDPAPDLTTPEKELDTLAYRDIGMPLFRNDTSVPNWQDIEINGGNPAAHAIDEDDVSQVSWESEPLAGAVGALVAANPWYVASLFKADNVTRPVVVSVPLYFKTRANPQGFERADLPVQNSVLTDNATYARGARPPRVEEDPMRGSFSALQPDSVAWFPLMQKQLTEAVQASTNLTDFIDVETPAAVMTAYTGNPGESRDLTRLGDPDTADAFTDGSPQDASPYNNALRGVLYGLPSITFDDNIANLVQSESRAATFNMRDGFGLSFLPNASSTYQNASAHWDGVFVEPALGGAHIHVKTDDGKVNEIFFADRPYVFLGVGENSTTGLIDQVMLADMSGATIDCNEYDNWMAATTADSDGVADWGVYGANYTLLQSMASANGMPLTWQDLPTKAGNVTLPYDLFKKLAVYTDQVNVPTTFEIDE